MKKISLLLSVLIVFTASCNENNYKDLGEGLFAEFDTNMGTMVVKLSYDKTPITVANFIALAEGNHPDVDSIHIGIPFYNGLIFPVPKRRHGHPPGIIRLGFLIDLKQLKHAINRIEAVSYSFRISPASLARQISQSNRNYIGETL